jgi:CRISPR/Cas system-associated endoribonuclease Cas2
VDNVVPLHNIETSALVEEASSFELIKERLVEAIHLGKLEQIYTQNKNIIDNNEDLLRIYKNRKESINEWQ